MTTTDDARLAEIEAREQAATAGPWMWQVNLEGKTVTLQGGRPRLDLSVMQFERWGMNRAAPTFMIPGQRDGMQAWQRAEVYASPVPGREHHANWFQRISHPDAEFIEHSREDVRYLLDRLKAAESCIGAAKSVIGRWESYDNIHADAAHALAQIEEALHPDEVQEEGNGGGS